MTVTPRGVGMSAGVKGARVSAHSSGRVTRTVGVPGSGISHTKTLQSGSKPSRGAAARQAPPPPPPAPKAAKPGMFAPRWEKDLHAALAKGDHAAYERIGASDAKARQTCQFLNAVSGPHAGEPSRMVESIEALWAEGYDPSKDAFLTKYVGVATMTLGIAEGVNVTLPADRDSLGLLLGEVRQSLEDLPGAIDVVEQVTPSTIAAVSLADLYAAAGRWQDVVDLTNGVANEDDFATFLLIQRGAALREQGYYDAAREALKTALAPRSRPATLRHMALVERGQTYLAEGKKAQARKDFEKVLAENAAYPGLSEHLASLG